MGQMQKGFNVQQKSKMLEKERLGLIFPQSSPILGGMKSCWHCFHVGRRKSLRVPASHASLWESLCGKHLRSWSQKGAEGGLVQIDAGWMGPAFTAKQWGTWGFEARGGTWFQVVRQPQVKRAGFEGPSTKCARKAEPKSHKKHTEPSKKRSQGKYRGRNALIQRLHAYLRQLQRDDRSLDQVFGCARNELYPNWQNLGAWTCTEIVLYYMGVEFSFKSFAVFIVCNNPSHSRLHLAFYSQTSCCIINLWSSNLGIQNFQTWGCFTRKTSQTQHFY